MINHSKSVAQCHLGWLHSDGEGIELLCKYHRYPNLASYSSLNLQCLNFKQACLFGVFFSDGEKKYSETFELSCHEL